jgi:hypothetical protein
LPAERALPEAANALLEAWLDAVTSGDADRAWALLHDTAKAGTTIDAFRADFARHHAWLLERAQAQRQLQSARASASVPVGPIQLELVAQGGRWLIVNPDGLHRVARLADAVAALLRALDSGAVPGPHLYWLAPTERAAVLERARLAREALASALVPEEPSDAWAVPLPFGRSVEFQRSREGWALASFDWLWAPK